MNPNILTLAALFFILPGHSQQEVELNLESGSALLSGTLLLPENNASKAVALFISGSGATDRDGNTGSQYTSNSLKMLAEGLAENGIASLRYDKRGVGKSTFDGNMEDVVFEDFTADTKGWLDLLKKDDRFERIFIIGHSQGSLVGALTSLDPEVEKFVSLAGIGSPADKVITDQISAQSPILGVAVAAKLDSIKAGYEIAEPEPPLNTIFRKELLPFLKSWMAHTPTEVFAQLEKPVLVVNGSTDIQVFVEEAELLHGAAPQSELLIVEGMNHVLKDAPSDRMQNIQVYSRPEVPLSDGLVEKIALFILGE